MNQRRLLAAAAALLATAAAGGAQAQRGGNGRGNLPAVACASGAPTATKEAQAAEAALDRTLLRLSDADKQRFYTTALTQAQAGIAADANNPYHHFLAGRAQAGLGHTTEALAEWDKTLQLCPEFRDEVGTARTEVVDAAFNAAIQKYAAGDTAAAIAGWEGVVGMDPARAEALFNLGVAYGQRNDIPHSVAAYRRLLAMTPAAADSTAAERRSGALAALLGMGATLFQQNKFDEAHDIFVTLRTADPNNRDAYYNDALALYKGSRWADEVPVATRLIEMDPLNYNARIILFNAYKGISEAAKARNDTATERTNRNLALHTLEAADALPVQVGNVQMASAPGGVTIKGTVTGASAAAGTPKRIEFTLTNGAAAVGTGTVTVNAPAKDQNAPFELTIPLTGTFTSWRYRLLP